MDCRIVEVRADAATIEEQFKELMEGEDLPKPEERAKIVKAFDAKKSSVVYKAWVGKPTLLLHRITWVFQAVIDKAKMPRPVAETWDARVEIEIVDYDKGLDIQVPNEVKRRLGLK